MAEQDRTQDFAEAFDYGLRASFAWTQVFRFLPVLFVGGFLRSCLQGGGAGNLSNFSDLGGESLEGIDSAVLTGIVAAIAMVVLVLVVGKWLVRSWFISGWYRALRASSLNVEPRFSELFSGSDRFISQLGVSLLSLFIGTGVWAPLVVAGGVMVAVFGLSPSDSVMSSMPFLGGAAAMAVLGVLCLFTSVYVGLGLAFAEMLVALEGKGALDSIVRSWEFAQGHRVRLLCFYVWSALLFIGLTLMGYCMLCIGVLVTLPIAYAVNDHALVDAYLRVAGVGGQPVVDEGGAAAGVQSAESPWDAPPAD